ncbi:hypothetical protein MTO96_046995 [Rhipicephalus appendiculatus]
MCGSPGPRPNNSSWRLDSALLQDETSVERIEERLRATVDGLGPITPSAWDQLKLTWRDILQEEGKARKRRITAEMKELQRRTQIVKSGDTLTACMSDYLAFLEAKYKELLLTMAKQPRCTTSQLDVVSGLGLEGHQRERRDANRGGKEVGRIGNHRAARNRNRFP